MGLNNMNKILLVAALGATLLTTGLSINNVKSVEEIGVDLNNSTGLKVRGAQIGSASDTSVVTSNIYSQLGQDDNGNYVLRFATAVSGPIQSIQYVREGIEGINEGREEVVEVSTVYKAIMAEGLPTYYDGDNLEPTTSDSWAGSFYWACYTIRYNSSKHYKTNVNVSLKVNDEAVGSKSTSLHQLANGVLRYDLKVQDGYLSDSNLTSGKFEAGSTVNLTSTKQAPENKHIAGWYNVENNQIVSKDSSSLTMPEGDIEVAPYADSTYIDPLSTVDAGVGKLDLNTYLVSAGGINENTWQGKSTISPKVTQSIVNGEGGKLYTKYSSTNETGDIVDAVVAGDFVIPMTAYKITAIEHEFEFTYQNLGSEDVKFKLYLVNASANAATVPDDAVEVVVPSNQVVSQKVRCKDFTNNNILPVMYFTDNIRDLKLGSYAYCTYVADHECLNVCSLCGKCSNANCAETVCSEKCVSIAPSKSVTVLGGKDFFKGSDWETCPTSTSESAVARKEFDLYNCRGELGFRNSTASRFNLFYSLPKADGTWGVHLADKQVNITNANATAMYNVEHEYEMKMTADGEFDLMLFGTSNANKTRGAKNSLYLNFKADGTMTLYHTSGTTSYVSSGEFSASTSFKTDGSTNTIKFNIIRNSGSKLTLKITINDQVVELGGTSSKSVFSIVDNCFVSNGVLNYQGYGQRFGVIPLGNTYVTISDLAVNIDR